MGKKAPKAPAAPDPSKSLVDSYNPYGSSVYTALNDGSGRYSNTTTLDPVEQQHLDTQRAFQGAMFEAARPLLHQIGYETQKPVNFNNLPTMPSSFNYGGLPDGVGYVNPGQIQSEFGGNSPLTMSVGANDFSADRQKVEDALYARNTSRLDPQFQQSQRAMETQLTNQGVLPGSKAWQNAMRDFNFAKNDAYSNARNDAIAQGGAEQGRLFGMDLSKAQFANTAAGQDYSQALGRGSFANAAQAQQFGQGQQNASLANALRGQLSQEQLSGAQLNAQLAQAARQQGVNELMLKRNAPLDEYAKLFGMIGAPNIPQFGDNGSATLSAGNNAAYQGQLNNYNQQIAQQNAQMGALTNLGGTLGAAWLMSDIAVKTDIERVGGKGELNIYEWRYKGDSKRYRGVMAQEVTHIPDAVIDDGEFLMVDYSKIPVPFEEVHACR